MYHPVEMLSIPIHFHSLNFSITKSSCGPLSFIDVPYKGCCTYDPNIINTILTYNTKHAITLKIFYLQSYKFFNNLSSDVIRRFFTPAHHVRVAINTLFSIRPKKNALNICVHIRRGDMINSTEALASDEKFSISALRYIHDKAREEDSRLPYTYVMSDDPEWAVSVFKVYDHLYVAVRGNRPPNTEWEFSRQYCDRVLLTASISTYGYWIGYLSRGQRVYYNYDFTHENGIEAQLVPTDFWPTHWIALRYNAVEDEVIEWSPDN
ncbi:hypothetical protein DICVIV_11220 [Dictyocaulus viviparus]|uniref:L-Fucosyltransferase n=1 Tax=Dictyocaulus viviparus TaxID=29172 RepID=A0A0D8XGC5_DICVI|nr:hypothetical protein DICVIV_11220 [Dictyocaulus viviparus]